MATKGPKKGSWSSITGRDNDDSPSLDPERTTSKWAEDKISMRTLIIGFPRKWTKTLSPPKRWLFPPARITAILSMTMMTRDPFLMAGFVIFLFPEGHTFFEFINDIL